MRTRVKTRILVMAVAALGLLLLPASAFAYAPSGDDFTTCVAGGDDNVVCVAGIFDPFTEVEVFVQINPVLLDTTLTADEDGEISFDFDVPEGQEDGEVTVELTGTKNGETFVLAEQVAAVEDGEVIANAGSDAALLGIGAAGAIALGGAALFVSRRKRTTTTA